MKKNWIWGKEENMWELNLEWIHTLMFQGFKGCNSTFHFLDLYFIVSIKMFIFFARINVKEYSSRVFHLEKIHEVMETWEKLLVKQGNSCPHKFVLQKRSNFYLLFYFYLCPIFLNIEENVHSKFWGRPFQCFEVSSLPFHFLV